MGYAYRIRSPNFCVVSSTIYSLPVFSLKLLMLGCVVNIISPRYYSTIGVYSVCLITSLIIMIISISFYAWPCGACVDFHTRYECYQYGYTRPVQSVHVLAPFVP